MEEGIMVPVLKQRAAEELRRVNQWTARYGLTLSEAQIGRIVERRFQALRASGRVEWGKGILQSLVLAFCDSPYVQADEYEATLAELIDSFYYFKGEAERLASDEEIIECMRLHFDEVCHGSLEYLNGTTLGELLAHTRGAGRRRGGEA